MYLGEKLQAYHIGVLKEQKARAEDRRSQQETFNDRQKAMSGLLKTKLDSTLPNNVKRAENNLTNVETQMKTLREQNELAESNVPEDDEDFIEYDLDPKEKLGYAAHDDKCTF